MRLLFICLVSVAAVTGAPSQSRRFRRGITRIIGGTNVGVGEMPYIATLQDTSFSTTWDLCAGAIYDTTTIITAGHCVAGDDFNNPSYLQVVVGDVNKGTEEPSEQTIVLSQIKRHPEYEPYTLEHDVAILKLKSPITFNSNVDKIAICTSQMAPNSGSCTVGGWGYTSETGDYSQILQKVTLPIVSFNTCQRNYDDDDINDFDTRLKEGMFCAGAVGKDTCQGDAGGPLICNGKLAGVASWGYGCGRPNYPEVFADICYHSSWITSNV